MCFLLKCDFFQKKKTFERSEFGVTIANAWPQNIWYQFSRNATISSSSFPKKGFIHVYKSPSLSLYESFDNSTQSLNLNCLYYFQKMEFLKIVGPALLFCMCIDFVFIFGSIIKPMCKEVRMERVELLVPILFSHGFRRQQQNI